jgi:hypothetical protein
MTFIRVIANDMPLLFIDPRIIASYCKAFMNWRIGYYPVRNSNPKDNERKKKIMEETAADMA